MNDQVKNPSHYKLLEDVEVISVIASAMTLQEWKGYCLGNILKYRLCAGEKDDLKQDIDNADFYRELHAKFKDLCRDDFVTELETVSIPTDKIVTTLQIDEDDLTLMSVVHSSPNLMTFTFSGEREQEDFQVDRLIFNDDTYPCALTDFKLLPKPDSMRKKYASDWMTIVEYTVGKPE